MCRYRSLLHLVCWDPCRWKALQFVLGTENHEMWCSCIDNSSHSAACCWCWALQHCWWQLHSGEGAVLPCAVPVPPVLLCWWATNSSTHPPTPSHTFNTHSNTHTHTHAHAHAYTYMYTHAHTHHTHTHTPTHPNIHCTHTHTHTHTNARWVTSTTMFCLRRSALVW